MCTSKKILESLIDFIFQFSNILKLMKQYVLHVYVCLHIFFILVYACLFLKILSYIYKILYYIELLLGPLNWH